MTGGRCTACGGLSGSSWACTSCKQRLPRELSQALFFAERQGMEKGRGVPRVMQSAARADALDWWAENPPEARTLEEPAWKRHSRKG